VLVNKFGCNTHAGQIMYQNAYGWFERVGKGVYTLSGQGKSALNDPMFARVVEFYRKELANAEI